MRIKKEKLLLPCILTDEEKLNYGVEMATERQRVSEAEGRKQSFNSQIKAEIENHEARADEIGHKLTSGKEYRNIECQVEYDWVKKTKTWIRSDNGEEAKNEIIPERELQEEMDLQEKEARKEQDDAVEEAKEEGKY